jgi:condensation enzyme
LEITETARARECLRYPVSYPQELWCAAEDRGAFGPHFTISAALRISGYVDPAALQEALDDVVERHEILRTVLRREPDGTLYQEVHPPCPVPLELRQRTGLSPQERIEAAEELLLEAESLPADPEALPVLRAILTRFDEDDWALALISHHTVGDTWSMQVIETDLAALYTARVTGLPVALTNARPYGEFALWQRSGVEGAASERNMAYWAGKLDGARIFTLPTDYPLGERSEPYEAINFTLEAELMQQVAEVAKASRGSVFHVLLAVLNILAGEIRETEDVVINTSSAGRSERSFSGTVGPCLNFITYRTKLDRADTFREVLARTRETCLEASSHEMPINIIQSKYPDLKAPAIAGSRVCDFIFGFGGTRFGGGGLKLAGGALPVQMREQKANDQPGGVSWAMGIASSGALHGKVQFNPGEFRPSTVRGWTDQYKRLMATLATSPDADLRAAVAAATMS